MNTSSNYPFAVFPREAQALFEIDGFTVEVCRVRESLEQVFRLRYQAYVQSQSIPENEEGLFFDAYDFMPHCFVHLIWYEGKPVATVRSCISAAQYQWAKTEGMQYFPEVVRKHLGDSPPLLESNRYATHPDFKGRKSLAAQMLLFRIHALCSAAHGSTHIITAVRDNHVPFYERFLGFKKISEKNTQVEKIEASVALLMVERDRCYELATQRGVPPITEEDIAHYKTCAQIDQPHPTTLSTPSAS